MEENKATREYKERHKAIVDQECEEYANMREIALDILFALKREGFGFANRLKDRVIQSKSKEEIRLAMDGLLVLSKFSNSFYEEFDDDFDGEDEYDSDDYQSGD